MNYLIKYPIESAPVLLTLFPLLVMFFRMAYYNRAMRFLFDYLCFKFIIDTAMLFMAARGINNLMCENLLIFTSFFYLSLMFEEVFINKYHKYILFAMMGIFGISVTWDLVHTGFFNSFRYSGVLGCALLLVMCLIYFKELIVYMHVKDILTYPFFFVICSLLLYCSACVFILPLRYYLDQWPINRELAIFTKLQYIIEAVYLVFMGFGLMVGKKNQKML